MEERELLHTDGLSVGYHGKELIKEIGISLKRGEIVTLIGPNGAGKSTILKTIAKQLQEICGVEARTVVPGHVQRGGTPCAYDRVLSTRFGAAAARLIREKNYGNMVGLVNGKIVPVPLSEVAGKLKTVPVDCEEILAAREIGISFGD